MIAIEWNSDTKVCTGCGDELPLSAYKARRAKDRRPRPRCIECDKEYRRDAQRKYTRASEVSRRYFLKKNYGITDLDFAKMLEDQENKCAICNQEETTTRAGKAQALSVDHCHDTGKVRGLLCSACNTSIGLMRENSDHLFSAVMYLRKHSSCKSTA